MIVLIEMTCKEQITGEQGRVSWYVADRYLEVTGLFQHVHQDCVQIHVVRDHVLGGDFLPV